MRTATAMRWPGSVRRMSAKVLVLRPISHAEADAAVKRWHYSGTVLNNSQLHMGVFYQGRLEGAMQFGPSMDKRKLIGLVAGTGWNEFIELNRLALSDALPRNSESRALAVAMKLLRTHAPHLKWVVSFADGAQCGDGTIYRASGFVLTGIQPNDQIWVSGEGQRVFRHTMTANRAHLLGGGASVKPLKAAGFAPIPGFQLRYLYFLDPTARERLTVPILPFSEIDRRGARMYRGQKPCVGGATGSTPEVLSGDGGSSPTATLPHSLDV